MKNKIAKNLENPSKDCWRPRSAMYLLTETPSTNQQDSREH